MPEIQSIIDKTPGAPVRGFLHVPPAPSGDGLVLTHSASASCDAPLLVEIANALAPAGVTVLRCDLPFRQARPHGPPPRGSAERDQRGLERAAALLRERVQRRVFLGGHSYGGRQASMLAAHEPAVADGLLLLSYPLHPPRRRDELRTAHFPLLQVPGLFIHGTRDGFGSIEEMTAALALIPAPTKLFPVAGAGHSLLTARNHGTLVLALVGEFRNFFS